MSSADNANPMGDVAVVGAGLAGLTAALRLTQVGCKVRVFERYPRPGGLARVLQIGGEPLEAFYHHLFTSDIAYVDRPAWASGPAGGRGTSAPRHRC